MNERKDVYQGVPRLWRGNRVYHGIVCGKGIKPRNCRVCVVVYMVREHGRNIYRATSGSGISQKAIRLAREVAQRNNLLTSGLEAAA